MQGPRFECLVLEDGRVGLCVSEGKSHSFLPRIGPPTSTLPTPAHGSLGRLAWKRVSKLPGEQVVMGKRDEEQDRGL